MYTECMKNISVDDDGGSWLSLDHTFSSASKFLCKRDNVLLYTCDRYINYNTNWPIVVTLAMSQLPESIP